MERRYNIFSVFNAIGGVSGAAALAGVFIYGGKMAEKLNAQGESHRSLETEVRGHSGAINKLTTTVDSHERRITQVETEGSIRLQRHEAVDDQRVIDMGERIKRCEDESIVIRNTLTDIRGDLREIKAHMGIPNPPNKP